MKSHHGVMHGRGRPPRSGRVLSRAFWITLAVSMAAGLVLLWQMTPSVPGWVWFK